jgi:hypothetical protein
MKKMIRAREIVERREGIRRPILAQGRRRKRPTIMAVLEFIDSAVYPGRAS